MSFSYRDWGINARPHLRRTPLFPCLTIPFVDQQEVQGGEGVREAEKTAGGRPENPPPASASGKAGDYFQFLKIVSIRVTASSTAFSLLQFSVTTREMALPQTFSV
jgi:hypothetical protein